MGRVSEYIVVRLKWVNVEEVDIGVGLEICWIKKKVEDEMYFF